MEESAESKLIKEEVIVEPILFVPVNHYIKTENEYFKSENDDVSSQDCQDIEEEEEEKYSRSEQFRYKSDDGVMPENKDCVVIKDECDFDNSEGNVNVNSELYKTDSCDNSIYIGESDVECHVPHHIESEQNIYDKTKFTMDTDFTSNRYGVNVIEYTSGSYARTCTEKKIFKCNLCDYSCIQSSYLVRHIRRHTREKPYKCDLCDFSCSLSGNLVHHIRRHTGEKPYKCNECDYSCTQSSNLVKHMKRHSGEKPYQCNVCNYSSIESSKLKRHMKSHTGERPFKCNACNFSCSLKANLVQHMRRHTIVKSYKCNICDYSCTQSEDLVIHKRRHSRAET